MTRVVRVRCAVAQGDLSSSTRAVAVESDELSLQAATGTNTGTRLRRTYNSARKNDYPPVIVLAISLVNALNKKKASFTISRYLHVRERVVERIGLDRSRQIVGRRRRILRSDLVHLVDALLQRVQLKVQVLQVQQIRDRTALRLALALGGLLDLAVVRANPMKGGLGAGCALRSR